MRHGNSQFHPLPRGDVRVEFQFSFSRAPCYEWNAPLHFKRRQPVFAVLAFALALLGGFFFCEIVVAEKV